MTHSVDTMTLEIRVDALRGKLDDESERMRSVGKGTGGPVTDEMMTRGSEGVTNGKKRTKGGVRDGMTGIAEIGTTASESGTRR